MTTAVVVLYSTRRRGEVEKVVKADTCPYEELDWNQSRHQKAYPAHGWWKMASVRITSLRMVGLTIAHAKQDWLDAEKTFVRIDRLCLRVR